MFVCVYANAYHMYIYVYVIYVYTYNISLYLFIDAIVTPCVYESMENVHTHAHLHTCIYTLNIFTCIECTYYISVVEIN